VRLAGNAVIAAAHQLGPQLSKSPLFLFLLLPLLPAAAATPAEETMNKALMPHATLSANGPKVLVHRVRLQGHPEANAEQKALVDGLRRSVAQCSANLATSGTPVRPPKVWPEYMISVRTDTYAAANRSITYTRNLGYTLNLKDCSLTEKEIYRAELVSNAGACNIDLIEKTASGVCDATLHETAATPRNTAPTPEQAATAERARSGAMGPEMAAMMKRMAGQMGGPSGVKKTILGLHCDVFDMPGQNEGASTCLATGGSFTVLPAPGPGLQRSLPLETRSRHGFSLKAVDARLDDSVNAAVFTPHLAAGFAITREPK